MKKEGWEFKEALNFLADKAGVELRPLTTEEQVAVEEHEGLRALLEEAVTFYRHQLLNTPPGKTALAYLKEQRGLSDETIEAFGIGYAPNSWEATANFFKSKGYKEEDLIAAGLAGQRNSGGVYDRFRHRVVFPIRDYRGRMAGFGARILRPDDQPKFLNSPQTELFDKSRLLYGLDMARRAIRAQDQVVIVEGYLDVIALHQDGYPNVVSPMGTALSDHQLRRLKRYTRRIVLALDPDAAGDQATLRGLEVARQTMDREADPVFDARGLLGHEARLQADIRVTTLPEGMDPDEVVQRDAGEWQNIVENARPVVVHVMETLAAGRDLDDPKVKSEIADRIIPLIADVPNEIERDTYRQRLARLLRVDERTLLTSVPPARRAARLAPRDSQELPTVSRESRQAALTTAASSNHLLESHCLGVLLRRPDLLYQVDRRLQDDQLARLTPEDFRYADHQVIMRVFQQAVDQDLAEPHNYVMNFLDLPMMEMADGMLARTTKLDPNDERVLEDLMRGLLDLRGRNLHQEIEHYQYLIQEAQEAGELGATQYLQTMVQLVDVKRRLDRALGKYIGRTGARQTS